MAEVLALRAEGGVNYRLSLRVDDWTGFEPGQFAMLSPGVREAVERSDPLLPRPMAIYREAQCDGAHAVEILFKRTGRGTGLLAAAAVGQEIDFLGPLGRGFADPEPGERAVLVAGGTGIASLYALAARLGSGATALLGARTADDLMAEADFAALGLELGIATEDDSRGTRGRVTDLLELELAKAGPARVYACGPTPMMRRAAEVARERGAACVVCLENHMACGFGICLGCAAPLEAGGCALVCRDGPMFDAQRIDWERLS